MRAITGAVASEIRPAIDLASLDRKWTALQDEEARTLAEIRIEKGKLLIQARKAFPEHGSRHSKGWLGQLEKWKITESTAQRYMKFAGYAETTTPTMTGVKGKSPTYIDAGITKPTEPESIIVGLIADGVDPKEAAVTVANDPDADRLAELNKLVTSMSNSSKRLFSTAQSLFWFCQQKEMVIISVNALAGMHVHLVAAKGEIQNVLNMMENGVQS